MSVNNSSNNDAASEEQTARERLISLLDDSPEFEKVYMDDDEDEEEDEDEEDEEDEVQVQDDDSMYDECDSKGRFFYHEVIDDERADDWYETCDAEAVSLLEKFPVLASEKIQMYDSTKEGKSDLDCRFPLFILAGRTATLQQVQTVYAMCPQVLEKQVAEEKRMRETNSADRPRNYRPEIAKISSLKVVSFLLNKCPGLMETCHNYQEEFPIHDLIRDGLCKAGDGLLEDLKLLSDFVTKYPGLLSQESMDSKKGCSDHPLFAVHTLMRDLMHDLMHKHLMKTLLMNNSPPPPPLPHQVSEVVLTMIQLNPESCNTELLKLSLHMKCPPPVLSFIRDVLVDKNETKKLELEDITFGMTHAQVLDSLFPQLQELTWVPTGSGSMSMDTADTADFWSGFPHVLKSLADKACNLRKLHITLPSVMMATDSVLQNSLRMTVQRSDFLSHLLLRCEGEDNSIDNWTTDMSSVVAVLAAAFASRKAPLTTLRLERFNIDDPAPLVELLSSKNGAKTINIDQLKLNAQPGWAPKRGTAASDACLERLSIQNTNQCRTRWPFSTSMEDMIRQVSQLPRLEALFLRDTPIDLPVVCPLLLKDNSSLQCINLEGSWDTRKDRKVAEQFYVDFAEVLATTNTTLYDSWFQFSPRYLTKRMILADAKVRYYQALNCFERKTFRASTTAVKELIPLIIAVGVEWNDEDKCREEGDNEDENHHEEKFFEEEGEDLVEVNSDETEEDSEVWKVKPNGLSFLFSLLRENPAIWASPRDERSNPSKRSLEMESSSELTSPAHAVVKKPRVTP